MGDVYFHIWSWVGGLRFCTKLIESMLGNQIDVNFRSNNNL